MFALTIQTGLRISELIGLNRQDVTLTRGAHVHTIGKGRKERRTPLVPATTTLLKAWLEEQDATSDDPLFPTITGKRLSRDAVERRLARHVSVAANACPSIANKRVTPHTLRHTAAMRLLLAGNDITVIALWLGHFSEERILSRGVAWRTVVRPFCHTLCLLCTTCMDVNERRGRDACVEGRGGAGVGVLDGRR